MGLDSSTFKQCVQTMNCEPNSNYNVSYIFICIARKMSMQHFDICPCIATMRGITFFRIKTHSSTRISMIYLCNVYCSID